MGKKRAASGAPVGDFSDGGSMMREQRDRWRQAHPPRNYFGRPLQRASKGRQFAGGVRARRNRQGVATEFLLFVPYHARIGVGQNTHPPLGKSDDELLVYDHSAPGESRSELLLLFQQQTSVRRWYELAGTHPGVTARHISPPSSHRQPTAIDERGRAESGDQGGCHLWLSLAGCGKKAFRAGISTVDVAPSLVACWRCPGGAAWTPSEIQQARRVWLDLCEVDDDGHRAFEAALLDDDVLEEDAGGDAAGAASGAPEGREKKKKRRRGSRQSREASKSQAVSSTTTSGAAEESAGAASGALPPWRVPLSGGGMSDADLALARRQGHHLRLSAATWPQQRDLRLQSAEKARLRAQRNSELITELMHAGWQAARPSEFCVEIGHLSANEEHRGELFEVPRAFATQKEHFLHRLSETFAGVGFDDPRFFCEAFPSLEPAPGGAAAEFVDCCNKHDGEARLLQHGEMWLPLAPDINVRDPAFWRQQFVVEEEESRQWLAQRVPKDKLLGWDDVAWVLDRNNDQTLLIRRSLDSASGRRRYDIRRGTAVTLACALRSTSTSCTWTSRSSFARPATARGDPEVSGISQVRRSGAWR